RGGAQTRSTVGYLGEVCRVYQRAVATTARICPGLKFPMVPGHEAIGTVDKLGPGSVPWKEGQRVGVGWHGGHCRICERCRRGDFINCRNLQIPGLSYDGGYAEYMIAPSEALALIPDSLKAAEGAPLLCAGVPAF